MGSLQGKCVVVVGRAGGIARAVTELARSEAAQVVDVTDDESGGRVRERVGPVDHVVSTVSKRARGTLAELDRAKLKLSFDTKVIGPVVLAKHFAPRG